jgi:hypothetical protein
MSCSDAKIDAKIRKTRDLEARIQDRRANPYQNTGDLALDAIERAELISRYERKGNYKKAEEMLAEKQKDATEYGRVLRAYADLAETTTVGLKSKVQNYIIKNGGTLTPKQKKVIGDLADDVIKAKNKITEIENKAGDKNSVLTDQMIDEAHDLEVKRERGYAKLSILASKIVDRNPSEMFDSTVKGNLLGPRSWGVNIVGNVFHGFQIQAGSLMVDMIKWAKSGFNAQKARERGAMHPVERTKNLFKMNARGMKEAGKILVTGDYTLSPSKFDTTGRLNAMQNSWSVIREGLIRSGLKKRTEKGQHLDLDVVTRRMESGKIKPSERVNLASEMMLTLLPDTSLRVLASSDRISRSSAEGIALIREVSRFAKGKKIKKFEDAKREYFVLKSKAKKAAEKAGNARKESEIKKWEKEARVMQEAVDKIDSEVQRASDYSVYAHDSVSSKIASVFPATAKFIGTHMKKGFEGMGLEKTGMWSDRIIRGIGTAAFPFAKIPANLIGMGLDGVLPVRSLWKLQKALKTNNDTMLREAVGGLMYSAAVHYIMATIGQNAVNVFTSEDEIDPNKRALKYVKSMKKGVNLSLMNRALHGMDDGIWRDDDATVSFDALGPVSMSMGILGGIQQALKIARKKEGKENPEGLVQTLESIEDWGNVSGEMAKVVYTTTTQMHLLNSAVNLITIAKDPGNAGFYLGNFMNTFSAPINPEIINQTLIKPKRKEYRMDKRKMGTINMLRDQLLHDNTIAQLVRPGTQYEKDNMATIDQIYNEQNKVQSMKIPHVNPWGEIVPNIEDDEYALLKTLDPFKTEKSKIDGYLGEIIDVMDKTGESLLTFPAETFSHKIITKNGPKNVTIKLMTADHLRLKMEAGNRKRILIKELMDSDNWDEMTPELKVKMIRKMNDIANRLARKILVKTEIIPGIYSGRVEMKQEGGRNSRYSYKYTDQE